MYSSYQAVVCVEKNPPLPRWPDVFKKLLKCSISSSQMEDVLGPQLPHLLEKFPGETSTGAEDYVAKEVPWLGKGGVGCFYLSTIKGIDLYGILALEKLIYFLGGLVASGGLHAIYIYRGGEREREFMCCVHLMFNVDDNCWCWMAMITANEKSSKPSTKLQRCMMADVLITVMDRN